MEGTWFVVISYDISDDRIRYRVGEILLDYGVRVQRSVYECRLTMDRFEEVRQKIEGFIQWETDSIRYYFLCGACEPRAMNVGYGRPPLAEPGSVIV